MCVVVVKSNALCGGICTFAKFPLLFYTLAPRLTHTHTLIHTNAHSLDSHTQSVSRSLALSLFHSLHCRSNKLLSAMQTHSPTHSLAWGAYVFTAWGLRERACKGSDKFNKRATTTACRMAQTQTHTAATVQAWCAWLLPSSVWGKRK